MAQNQRHPNKKQQQYDEIELYIQQQWQNDDQNNQKTQKSIHLVVDKSLRQSQLGEMKQRLQQQQEIKEQKRQAKMFIQSYLLQLHDDIISKIINQKAQKEIRKQRITHQQKRYNIQERKMTQELGSAFIKKQIRQMSAKFKIKLVNHNEIGGSNRNSQEKYYGQLPKKQSINNVKKCYDQINDKNLVQYFSTKKSVFNSERTSKKSNVNGHKERKTHQQFKIESSNKQNSILVKRGSSLGKATNTKSIQIRRNIDRFMQFNKFDIMSCETSLFHSGNKNLSKIHRRTKKQKQKQKHKQKWNQSQQVVPVVEVLKSRMNKLQNEIQTKIPYLVEMGVKLIKNDRLR